MSVVSEIDPTVDDEPSSLNRAGWMVIDQGANSAFNLLLGLISAWVLSGESFGAFSVLYAAYLLLRGVFRSLVLEPILIHHPREAARKQFTVAVSIALLASLATTGGLAVVALWGSSLRIGAIGAWGFLTAVLLISDVVRTVYVGAGGPRSAALVSLRMLVLLAGCSALAYPIVEMLALFLGLAAVAVSLALIPERKRFDGGGRSGGLYAWIAEHRSTGGPILGDFMASAAISAVSIFVLGAVDLAEAGALRAAQMVAAPLHMLYVALAQFIVVECARSGGDSRVAAEVSRRIVAGMVGVGTVYLVLLTAFVDPTSRLLGDSSAAAAPVLVPVAAMAVISCFSYGGSAALRAQGRAKEGMHRRLIAAIPQVAAVAIGVAVGGALEVAVAGAMALFLTIPVWISPLRTRDRQELHKGTPDQ